MDFTIPTINNLAFYVAYLTGFFSRVWSCYHGNNKTIHKIVRNAFKCLTLVFLLNLSIMLYVIIGFFDKKNWHSPNISL